MTSFKVIVRFRSTVGLPVFALVAVILMISTVEAVSLANFQENVRLEEDFRDFSSRSQEGLQENVGDARNQHEHKVRLMRKLQDNLPQFARELEPPNVEVKFKLSIINVQYDNDTGIATTVVWEQITWKDPRWTWSPEEFGGISVLRMETWAVWQPDITLYNSLNGHNSMSDDAVLLWSDGSLLWIPRAVYRTYCNADYSAREVSCEYKVGSWVYDGNTVGLGLYGSETPAVEWATESVETSDFDEACGAKLTGARARIRNAYYECCPNEPYPVYEAQVTFIPRGW